MNEKKKKILLLVDWFAPGYKAGGPIQSTVNVAFALKEYYDIRVCTTDTDHGEAIPYENIPANQWTTLLDPEIKVFYARKATLNAKQVRQLISETDADYIYLNLLFSPLFVVYPLWLRYTGKLKGQVVLCPRGTLYDSALAIKPLKKKIFINLFRLLGIHKRILFHATNEREKKAILNFFPGSNVRIADNLPKTNQPDYTSCIKEPGRLKCIFIARIVSIKNLLFLLDALNQVKGNVELSVVGPVEDNNYWQQCQAVIRRLPATVQVNYLGARPNHELPELVQQHHLFILPTTGENFGHSIFEALLAGRPVLISDQTPWLHLAEKKAGWDLPLSNKEAFTRVLNEMTGWHQGAFDEWGQGAWEYAHRFITNPGLIKPYLDLFYEQGKVGR
jgi:glycosyltransferase involved in cell wall biosynthesis